MASDGNPGTLVQWLQHHAASMGDSPAVIVWAEAEAACATLSFSELYTHMRATVEALSRLLRPESPAKGQRVAILAHNSPAYLLHSLACMAVGAIAVHINWRMSAATIGEQLSDLDCSVLLVSSALEALGREAAALAPQARVQLLDERLSPAAAQQVAASPALSTSDGPAPEDVAVVFFTSGSTGKPKAIPHTHASLVWFARHYTASLPEVFDPSVPKANWGSLSFAPYFHVMGFVANTAMNLVQGAPAYILAEHQPLDARLLASASLRLRPRALNTVPYIVEGLCALLRDGDGVVRTALSGLSLLTYGGAALPSHCAATLRAHGIRTACTYGQTETAGPVMLGEVSGDLNALRPFGGVTYELVSDEPEAEDGNLVFHGLGCVSHLRFGPSGDLVATRAPDDPYDTRDKFREEDIAGSHSPGPWLLYACREDDVLVHTSGEMTNPYPTEDRIKSLCPALVKNVCMVGNNLPRPALLIELCEGVAFEDAASALGDALGVANAELAEYSRVTLEAAWVLQPPQAEPLPVSMKGNVVRAFAERRRTQLADGVEVAPTLAVGMRLGDLVTGNGKVMDSMAAARSSDGSILRSHELAVYGHACFLVAFSVVSVHYLIHGDSWPAEPMWLASCLRLPLHSFVMPLAFMLVSVMDSARFAGVLRARAEEKRTLAVAWNFVRDQLLKPYAMLLVWKVVLDYGKRKQWQKWDGAWSPMWFFYTVFIFRLLRLLTWAVGLSERAFAVLSVVAHLASAHPDFPLAHLRRCLHGDSLEGLTFAHDALGGRQKWGALLCAGPYPPQEPYFLLEHTLMPFWWSFDQPHIYAIVYLPYYTLGPWLLARVLRSEKRAPHSANSPLGVRCLLAAITYGAIAYLWLIARESNALGPAQVCKGQPGNLCCRSASPMIIFTELEPEYTITIFAVTSAALAFLSTSGRAAVRFERGTFTFIFCMSMAIRLNDMSTMPPDARNSIFPTWQHHVIFDGARFIGVSAMCISLVELLPRTPSALSLAGFKTGLPIYLCHLLFFPYYSDVVTSIHHNMPAWLIGPYSWTFVQIVVIVGWVLGMSWTFDGTLFSFVSGLSDPQAILARARVAVPAVARVACTRRFARPWLLVLMAAAATIGYLHLTVSPEVLNRVTASCTAQPAERSVLPGAGSAVSGRPQLLDHSRRQHFHHEHPSADGQPARRGHHPPVHDGKGVGSRTGAFGTTGSFARLWTLPRESTVLVNAPCEGCPHPKRDVPSLHVCRSLCLHHHGCTGWVYNTRSECYLKGGKLEWAEETWQEGTTWSSELVTHESANADANPGTSLADLGVLISLSKDSIVSYRENLNRSMRIFWTMPHRTSIVVEKGDLEKSILDGLAFHWPFPIISTAPSTGASSQGVARHQGLHNSKFNQGLHYLTADRMLPHMPYIAIVQAETLFISSVTRGALFDPESGKPYMVAQIGTPPADSVWAQMQLEASRILGGSAPLVGSAHLPFVVSRAHLVSLRSHVIRLHNQTFVNVVHRPRAGQNAAAQPNLALDVIANYLWLHHRTDYSWRLQRVGYGPCKAEYCSSLGLQKQSPIPPPVSKSFEPQLTPAMTQPLPRVAIRVAAQTPSRHGAYDQCAQTEKLTIDSRLREQILSLGWCLSPPNQRLADPSKVKLYPKETQACKVQVGKLLGRDSVLDAMHWAFECTDWRWDSRTSSALKRFYGVSTR